MGWERQKTTRQQNYPVGIALRRCLHNCHKYLVRGMLVVSVAIIVILGVSDNGADTTIYAAPDAQSPSDVRTLAIVGAAGATLYASPGGQVRATLTPGTVMTAVGRSSDNLWVVVQNDEDLLGWMEVSQGVLFGLEQLPVMAEGTSGATPSADAAGSQPTPTAMPTLTLGATPLPAPLPVPTLVVSAVGEGQLFLIAVVQDANAGLYDQPNGTLKERLPVGIAVTAQGRSSDGQWLMVSEPSGAEGWVQITEIVVSNIEVLPILDAATGLPVATSSENTGAVATNAQPIPTPEAMEAAAPEVPATQQDALPSPQLGTTLLTDPNAIVARVSLTDSRLNIRVGPGLDFTVIGQADPNDTFGVRGRNTAATWLNIDTPGVGEGMGWVSAEYVALSQPILGIADTETNTQLAPTPTPVPAISEPPVVASSIGCKTSQIITWDEAQASWVCSDEIAALQAAVAILQAEVASLRIEIAELKK